MEVENKIIFDNDITIEMVKELLNEIEKGINELNLKNLTDIAIISEEIYAALLNELWGCKFHVYSVEGNGTTVAVDLYDERKKLAVQITTQKSNWRDKIKKTLKKLEKFERDGKREVERIVFIFISTKEINNLKGLDDFSTKFKSYRDIYNHTKIIEEIKVKNIIIKAYHILRLFFDINQLSNRSILEQQAELVNDQYIKNNNSYLLNPGCMGTGDINIRYLLPYNFYDSASCKIEFIMHEIKGMEISLNELQLKKDYFIDLDDFIAKHWIVKERCERDSYIMIENCHFKLNSNSISHLYELMCKLEKKYTECMEDMGKIIGIGKYKIEGMGENRKVHLFDLYEFDWKKLVNYGIFHNETNIENLEENVFHVNGRNSIYFITNDASSSSKSIIYAKIFIEKKDNSNRVKVFWQPGVCGSCLDMKDFSNGTLWGVEQTANFIMGVLKRLNETKNRESLMDRIIRMVKKLEH